MSDTNQTSWTQIFGASAGKEAELDGFSRKYMPVVYAYLMARWKGSRLADYVDDATQEVFVQCLKDKGCLKKANPDHKGGFRAFLFGVTRNVALMIERERVRSENRKKSAAEKIVQDSMDDSTPQKEFEKRWALTVVQTAASLLKARASEKGPEAANRVELLKLRFQDDIPIREIAIRWGVEASFLHREYSKARKEFREAIETIVAEYAGNSPKEIEQECDELLEILN